MLFMKLAWLTDTGNDGARRCGSSRRGLQGKAGLKETSCPGAENQLQGAIIVRESSNVDGVAPALRLLGMQVAETMPVRTQ